MLKLASDWTILETNTQIKRLFFIFTTVIASMPKD